MPQNCLTRGVPCPQRRQSHSNTQLRDRIRGTPRIAAQLLFHIRNHAGRAPAHLIHGSCENIENYIAADNDRHQIPAVRLSIRPFAIGHAPVTRAPELSKVPAASVRASSSRDASLSVINVSRSMPVVERSWLARTAASLEVRHVASICAWMPPFPCAAVITMRSARESAVRKTRIPTGITVLSRRAEPGIETQTGASGGRLTTVGPVLVNREAARSFPLTARPMVSPRNGKNDMRRSGVLPCTRHKS